MNSLSQAKAAPGSNTGYDNEPSRAQDTEAGLHQVAIPHETKIDSNKPGSLLGWFGSSTVF